MPLVLPPTVLGFYLLILPGPAGTVGRFWESLGGPRLVFSFSGLVVGSVLYSLPFVIQPLHNAFRAVPCRLLDAADHVVIFLTERSGLRDDITTTARSHRSGE